MRDCGKYFRSIILESESIEKIELFDNNFSAEDVGFIFDGLRKQKKGQIEVSFGDEDRDRIVADILRKRRES